MDRPEPNVFDARAEQFARLRAVQALMLKTARELVAAHALGLNTKPLFSELEVLTAVEAREQDAFKDTLDQEEQ